MNQNNNDYTWMGSPQPSQRSPKQEWRCPVSLLLVLLLVTVAATTLLTFNITSKWIMAQDLVIIQEQQQVIDDLRETLENNNGDSTDDLQGFGKLQALADLLQIYSYYSNEFNTEQMLDEVLRAYTQATGDKYAAYYTEEEYAELKSDSEGSGVGIGVNVAQEPLEVDGQTYLTFNIIRIFNKK
jgi:C-terminal processing protease CtpA/Prc